MNGLLFYKKYTVRVLREIFICYSKILEIVEKENINYLNISSSINDLERCVEELKTIEKASENEYLKRFKEEYKNEVNKS